MVSGTVSGAQRGVQAPASFSKKKLSLRQRLQRQLAPTKLWNTRFENAFLRTENWLRRGTTDFFLVVEVETTSACNRRCSYCPNSAFDRGLLKNEQRLSEELFERLLDQLAELKFTGRLSPHFYGEPLLDDRLERLVARYRTRLPLAKVVIFSNGDYLTVDRYLSLIDAGVDGFLVTQHSQQELPGVRAVQTYRRAHGADGVRFDFRAFSAQTELSNRGGLVQHALLETKADCHLPADNVTIDHEGNVILCCNDYFSSVSFGNIGREHLGDIWNKPSYVRLREELKRGRFELEICRKCAAGHAVALVPEHEVARDKRPLPIHGQRAG